MFLFALPTIGYANTQDDWIEELHLCENRNNVEKVLDSNNRYSYGAYMFQLDTFYGFGKQYGFFPAEFTKEEARLMIHIPSLQKAIAKEMLNDGLWRHWKHCAEKISVKYPLSASDG